MAMTQTNPSVGVIGCGYWGKNLVRNFHELGSLAAICDVDTATVNALAAQYSVSPFSVAERLLERPEVKAIAIATPAGQHYEIAKKALLAGKDVFVEKPLALHLEEGEELVALSSRLNRILMVGHLLQYHPAILELRRLLQVGELGRVNYLYSSRLNFGKLRTEENILWSFAPHDISAILFLLNERPEYISAEGASYLNHSISDITVTNLDFASGAKAHIFVSWLHPFKEQKLVVVGDRKMAVFNDTLPTRKLVIYPHQVDWVNRVPIARKAEGIEVQIGQEEPLLLECRHFLDSVRERKTPRTDGENGLAVLRILHACEESTKKHGQPITVRVTTPKYYVHPTAIVDQPCEVGDGTHIWHFSHVMGNSKLGAKCNLGQNVHVGSGVRIGNNVKIQNNVSVYTGVELEDDVFCGPSMVFTNVINPRSHVNRKDEYRQTVVHKGATLGANSTVVCGVTIGKYAFVAAGAVVTHDIPDHALVMGVPAQQVGWMCQCGIRLAIPASLEQTNPKRSTAHSRNGSTKGAGRSVTCNSCGTAYELNGHGLRQAITLAATPARNTEPAKALVMTA
jgi:UDP-2-acetamido-3-amino-2,3-dideoxy-glucuronate N-acetyltransferase